MAGRDRSGSDRPGIGRYEEYNGFGKYSRDGYVGFEDDEDRVIQALRDNTEGDYYEDGGEYYDEDEGYYDDGEYYDDEEYYDDDDYYEDDYYEDEPEVRRREPSGRKKPAGRRQKKRKAKASGAQKAERGRSGRQGTKKKKRIWLFILEIFVFIALLIALFVIMKWSKVNKEDLSDSQIYINEEIKAALEETPEELDDSGGSADWGMKGYKNVALFGVDAGGTRSDTIIIASINTTTYEVKMCSVYRDTYLNIDSMENPVYNKANSAYSKGGPEQAIRMLNMNLDMNVDDFVTVDFDALEDIIDDLGGVEIDVQAEEVDYINDYQFSIVMDLGGPNEGKIKNPRNFIAVTEPGLQTLNGLQATAYCRIRYTAGSDFRRTERQREVINQIVQKAKKAPITKLNKILDDVLPQITTSFSAAEFAEYASKVGSYTIADTKGFPFVNVTGNIGKQSMVVPDTLVFNVADMHTFLFGPSDYTPTHNVQVISEKIENDREASGL
ncbi:MAG: LCP family protein [Lachnospiraceae bacterium]|nr:LCP family protein [Lachnospiraceae bacterium]